MNVPAPAAQTRKTLIAASGLSVELGHERILDSVSLSVRAGEIVTLIGPNGSGKTTLVRALLGIVPISGGRIERHASRVGYVPQYFARDKSLPMTALHFAQTFGETSEAEARAALKRTGAAHTAERQLSALSGGEMARVALARALLKKPELLVLDEPLAGVDVSGEAALYELIGEIRCQTGTGVLLISHDLHVVMAAADHVVCLNRHVCCEGDARAVAKDPAFIALFGPRVAEQIAFYTHHHDHTHDHSEHHHSGHGHG